MAGRNDNQDGEGTRRPENRRKGDRASKFVVPLDQIVIWNPPAQEPGAEDVNSTDEGHV